MSDISSAFPSISVLASVRPTIDPGITKLGLELYSPGRIKKVKQVTKHTEDTHSKLHSKSFQSFSSRRNDFHGADNYYGFRRVPRAGRARRGPAATEAGTTNTLRFRRGQVCRLDSKYGRILTKEKNVPILIIANQLPKWAV